MISFACPSCSRAYRTPDETAGKRTMCPNCQALLTVPNVSVPAESQTVARAEPQPIRPLPVRRRKSTAAGQLKGRASVAPGEVGVLCERCLTVFGAKPECEVPCPRCEEPCLPPGLGEVLGA